VNAKDGIRPKSTVATIYKLIDSDLNVASHYLPLNWEVSGANRYPGRLTNGTANALWAQTFLFRKQWDSVIKYCNLFLNGGQ
jgi:starch-binding outer membrane protein, SusD/RagB family